MSQNTQFKTLLMILSSLFLLSCSGNSVAGGDQFPSILPEDPTAGFDTANFFIAVRNTTEVNSHFRTAGSFSSRCEIAENSANQDLTCIVDVPEGDLYYHGLDFVYNIPPNMCRYLERQTYWYYNNEVGTGPANIHINITLNATNAITASNCTVDGVGPLACNSTNFPELQFTIRDGDITPKCVYNRTEAREPNCCFGNYTLSKTITTPDTTTYPSSDLSWGDRASGLKSCLGGAARTNWPVNGFSTTGYPRALIVPADEGLSDTYELVAPIQKPNSGNNFSIANYYTSPVRHAHTSFGTALTSNLPYFINPITDRSGSLIPTGNDAYDFRCLDEAYEVRHRIRVYVREWDAFSDYLTYIATAGVTAVPDRPADTDVGCGGLIDDCNDIADADDYTDFLQALTVVVPPANQYYDQPGEELLRIYNFPADRY